MGAQAPVISGLSLTAQEASHAEQRSSILLVEIRIRARHPPRDLLVPARQKLRALGAFQSA